MRLRQQRFIRLASTSPRRKAYLERFQLDFSVLNGRIDETAYADESPEEYVERMAREKAWAVRRHCEGDDVVLSADTIVVLDGEIMGKPESTAAVLPMLRRLNGRRHQVLTSYLVLDCRNDRQWQRRVTTQVTFMPSDERLLHAYAATSEPLDKAGAYSIQGIGTVLVQSIEGSYNNVVGLPIEQLIPDLITLGILSFEDGAATISEAGNGSGEKG